MGAELVKLKASEARLQAEAAANLKKMEARVEEERTAWSAKLDAAATDAAAAKKQMESVLVEAKAAKSSLLSQQVQSTSREEAIAKQLALMEARTTQLEGELSAMSRDLEKARQEVQHSNRRAAELAEALSAEQAKCASRNVELVDVQSQLRTARAQAAQVTSSLTSSKELTEALHAARDAEDHARRQLDAKGDEVATLASELQKESALVELERSHCKQMQEALEAEQSAVKAMKVLLDGRLDECTAAGGDMAQGALELSQLMSRCETLTALLQSSRSLAASAIDLVVTWRVTGRRAIAPMEDLKAQAEINTVRVVAITEKLQGFIAQNEPNIREVGLLCSELRQVRQVLAGQSRLASMAEGNLTKHSDASIRATIAAVESNGAQERAKLLELLEAANKRCTALQQQLKLSASPQANILSHAVKRQPPPLPMTKVSPRRQPPLPMFGSAEYAQNAPTPRMNHRQTRKTFHAWTRTDQQLR